MVYTLSKFMFRAGVFAVVLLAKASVYAQSSAAEVEADRDRIFASILARNLDALKSAVSRSNAINARDETGETPLIRAAETGSAEMVQVVLDHGGDANLYDNRYKRNALFAAAGAGSAQCMKEILSRGGDASKLDYAGATLLMVASSSGNVDAVRIAVQSSTLNAVDRYGRSALAYAVRASSTDTVKVLLSLHEKTNQPDSVGWTPLHVAALMDTPRIAELLVRAGAQVDAESTSGETPLILAARALSAGVVEALLKAHASAMKSTRLGRNALMQACAWTGDDDVVPGDYMERKVANVVQLLVGSSNLAAKDSNGETALELARKNGHRLAADVVLAALRVRLSTPH